MGDFMNLDALEKNGNHKGQDVYFQMVVEMKVQLINPFYQKNDLNNFYLIHIV